jgi:adenine-specific DNA-methyltransferase
MSFYKTIENLLLKLDKFQDKEGKLLKSLVIDSAFKIDSDLIELLITNEQAKAKFFKEIAGYWVFNINDFILFIQDKNFLDDSYTRFKNKIGLNIDDKFLNQRKEVALVWPYKDCVLEGNQDKEDTKRQEIFFNEVLAQDEIDRLLDPKVLVNWTRHTANGEVRFSSLRSTHEVGEVDYSTQQTSPRQSSTATPQEGNFFHRDENGTIKENLLIKGNNLLALHTLKKQFRSKIKLIYIDPPYNTGNDGFKYNDRFNHSTWLTFMKNRLEVARELLRDDGVIFVQCDYRENSYLRILLDEIFGREMLINEISWKKYSGVKNQASNRLTTQHETILAFAKSSSFKPNSIFNPLSEKYVADEYKYFDESGRRYAKLRGRGFQDGNSTTKIKYLDENLGSPITTLWSEDNLQLNTSSAEKNSSFIGQKPEALLKRIIELGSNSGDIVLDFHAGTGTTGAVAHKMNRQWILVEQMDYIKDLPEARLKKVIGKSEKRKISDEEKISLQEILEKLEKGKNSLI